MLDLLKVHSEKMIGIKKLTDADLGKGTSHQTHIGLLDGILGFLSNRDSIVDSLFIYNKNTEVLPANLDRIHNPDGSFRSPKIKIGNQDISVTKNIRNICRDNNQQAYLLWFGLDNEQAVFLLFYEDSKEYSILNNIKNLNKSTIKISGSDKEFNKIIQYLETLVNESSIDYIEEIEEEFQTNLYVPNRKIIKVNLERLQKLITETGRYGEEIVNEYLYQQKKESVITDFSWENKSRESYNPYDFTIINNTSQTYIDVKSSRSRFESKMFFSRNEIEFIDRYTLDNYQIFRVFELYNSSNVSLKKCKDSKSLFSTLNTKINTFSEDVNTIASVKQISFAITPNHRKLHFEDSILLKDYIR